MKSNSASALTTQSHINIAEVRNGIIITKTAMLKQVLKVHPVNFALKSDQEQMIIIGQYQNFLNALTFPIQIVVHSRRLDVMPYAHTLMEQVSNIGNELLRYHGLEYIDFVLKLTSMVNIMDKQFYVVVGYEPQNFSKSSFFGGLFGKKEQKNISFSSEQWKKYTDQMNERIQLVINGLTAIGLPTKTLSSQETISLFYSLYNPDEGVAEKLTDVQNLEATIISTKNMKITDAGTKNQEVVKNVLSQTPLPGAQNQAAGGAVPPTAMPNVMPTQNQKVK